MRRKAAPRVSNFSRDSHNDFRFHSAFLRRKLRTVFRIVLSQRLDQLFKTAPARLEPVQFQVFPVRPGLEELGIEAIFIKNDFGHGQQDCSFRARIGWHPVIRHAGGMK